MCSLGICSSRGLLSGDSFIRLYNIYILSKFSIRRYETMKICIVLAGCDDSTSINDVEVTEEQLILLETIAKLSEEKSESACMPIMRIQRR